MNGDKECSTSCVSRGLLIQVESPLQKDLEYFTYDITERGKDMLLCFELRLDSTLITSITARASDRAHLTSMNN